MQALPEVLDPRDARPEVQRALCAWLAFQAEFAWHPERGLPLLERTGDPGSALRACGLARSVADPAGARALALLRRSRAVAVSIRSGAYPEALRRLADAPPLLLLRGDAAVLRARSVAVVGARAPSAYGLAMTRDIAGGLARAGLVVVSGLARGIDAAAHRAALEAPGRSIAVQGCGPDRVYPAAHRQLADRIAAHGAIVSELPPEAPPHKHHFPFRNRIISALAEAVVIVEARQRSGSLITARHAADQDVAVFAVPGPVTAPTSRGTNELLREGAFVALGAEDVLYKLGVDAAPVRAQATAGKRLAPPLRAILRALSLEPLMRDELGRRLGLEPEKLAPLLFELELDGRVASDRDGRLFAVSLRAT